MSRFRSTVLNTSERQAAEKIVRALLAHGKALSEQELERLKNSAAAAHRVSALSHTQLLAHYDALVQEEVLPEAPWLRRSLRKRSIRTLSGIAPISVLTKPFPCPGKCIYCPAERVPEHGKTLFELDSAGKYGDLKIPKRYRIPGALVMPKSYISSEPAAMRALSNGFDPWKQVTGRLAALRATGHTPDKCELIVMGGTFSFLPKRYQAWFVKRCLQALNGDNTARKKMNVVQTENEAAPSRAIGIVLETRPDHMTSSEARRFRYMGCTRVEMGVQTLDDAVSKLTKRGHGRAEVATATKILRDAGFKICHHMMPGLPGSTPQGDVQSFHQLYTDQHFRPDYLKIYPCVVTPFSELEHWFRSGKFQPYTDAMLIPMLLEIKKMTPPWVRITRLIRDIPGTAILGGSRWTNLRQHLAELMAKEGRSCQCIRCREVRSADLAPHEIHLKRLEYAANDGKEIFLSFETAEGKLVSLLRLRIPSWFFPENPGRPIFPALKNCAFVRELHTYGELIPVGAQDGLSQHRGWGKKLMAEAERIVREEFQISRLAVISGIGVKEYYRRLGYAEEATYMIKDL